MSLGASDVPSAEQGRGHATGPSAPPKGRPSQPRVRFAKIVIMVMRGPLRSIHHDDVDKAE